MIYRLARFWASSRLPIVCVSLAVLFASRGEAQIFPFEGDDFPIISTGDAFSDWLVENGLPIQEAIEEEDPDEDRLPHLLEFLLGGDPGLFDRADQFVELGVSNGASLNIQNAALTLDPDKQYATYSVRIRRARGDVNFQVVAASMVDGLITSPLDQTTIFQIGDPKPEGDFDRYLFVAQPALDAAEASGRMFFRLEGLIDRSGSVPSF